MEKYNYHVNMAGLRREIPFPFQLAGVGHYCNNPPRKYQHADYPDKIEICIRLSADTSEGLPTQTIAGKSYENLSFPHVVVKPPEAEYSSLLRAVPGIHRPARAQWHEQDLPCC